MEASSVWGRSRCTLVANDVENSLVELAMLTMSLGVAPHHQKHYLSENIFDAPEELTRWYGKVDYILANPPFSLRIENEQFESPLFLSGYRNSDALFLDTALKLLRPEGRLVCLLPHSVIANSDFSKLRTIVEESWAVVGVICLPEGVFQLSAGTTTRADIVVLDKLNGSRMRAHKKVFASTPSVGIRLNNIARDTVENDLERLVQDAEVRVALGL